MSPAPQYHRPSATAKCLTAAAALLLAGSLAACSPANTGLQRDTAGQLQESVLGVSRAAAGNDLAAALTALDTLGTDVAAEAGKGNISEERRRSIMTAAAAVRADVMEAKALADAAAAAAKAAEDAAAAQKQAAADAAAAEAAKVAPAPAAPAPDEDKGNKGKGNNDDD